MSTKIQASDRPSETKRDLSTRRLEPTDRAEIEALFAAIATDPDANQFHPHPFTAEEARKIAEYTGKDLYLGGFYAGKLVGYGMLRGWDAGFQIPSLGIYIVPAARKKGWSGSIMKALHRHARDAGAQKVRLKVYPNNRIAVRLYESLGYFFAAEEAGQLIGILDLAAHTEALHEL